MSCEASTAEILRRHGLRLTRPREAIVAALRHSPGHRVAPAILAEVQRKHPSVNPSTVYRTLAAFKQVGLISETDLGTGELSYSWLGPERHHHLICHRCGKTIEMDHRYLAPLETSLRQDFGFTATVDHFAIFGFCGSCDKAAADDATAAPDSD